MAEKAARATGRTEALRITHTFMGVATTLMDAAGGDDLHGYAIIKATGFGGPTVYKILERMTDMGWVTARWDDSPEDPNKPRRRYYRLTSGGAEAVRALIAERQAKPRMAFRPAFGGGHL